MGPDETLSSFDLAGILFPTVPAGIPFPVGPDGPVGPVGTLSPSESDSVGPVGPDRTLSSSVFTGMLIPAVPAGLPFPAGPVRMLSLSDFESAGPVGPVGTLPTCGHETGLSPIVPVGELSSVDPVCRSPGGLVPVVWTEFPDGRDPVITQLPAEVLVGDYRDVVDMDVTMDNCQAVPDVVIDRAVVAMVGLDTVRMGEETLMDCDGECLEWDICNKSLKQSTACLFIMAVICMIRISRIRRILLTLRMRNMWICITLTPQKEWN